jgi:hypothetical protein
MMDNKISVDGYPDLYRDPISGAIINNNKNEYDGYIKSLKARMNEKQRISNMECDLDNIKCELNEIKSLLKALCNTTDSN